MADSRDGHGRFTRNVDSAERDAEAARLRAGGWTLQQIADHFGVNRSSVKRMIDRVLAETIEEPAAQVRAFELERLDLMWQAVMKVLEARHVTVSQGKVVYLGDEPLADDAPVLQAVDRLLKIQARRAALLGLDAPAKQEVGGKLTYEIAGVDLDKL